MLAAVSPRDKRIGVFNGQAVAVFDREKNTCGKLTPPGYLSRYPDTAFVEADTFDEAYDSLKRLEENSLCLDMMLFLFDNELSIETRREVSNELNSLLQIQENKNYALDIILAKPLPEAADIMGATEAAKGCSVTSAVLRLVLDCQERVQWIFESWLSVSQEPIVRQNDVQRVFGILCRYGIFRTLALRATDTSELQVIKPQLILNAEMNEQLPVSARIVQSLIERFQRNIPQTDIKTLPPSEKSNGSYGFENGETLHEPPKHATRHAAYSAALSQVDKVAELYIQERDPQAEAILNELIEEQGKHRNSENYIVKSLTNIATKAGAGGRPDAGLKCLQRALDFKSGIDSVLYLHIGAHLREDKQFDKALECYELARQLDDGTLANRIRLDAIHVTTARGDYAKAVSEYLAIPDLRIQPLALLRLGTLYRKMGKLQDSRRVYQDCLGIDDTIHAAYAGLAEIRKQSGKPHRAIAEYNDLLRRFNDLDHGSKRVYHLSLSHLFRLTAQYEKAERILGVLEQDYPADRDIHIQLAKLLELQGKHNLAKKHYRKATGGNLKDLGQLIFTKARSLFDEDLLNENIESIPTSLSPDETGLKTCFQAYTAITEAQYEMARLLLDEKVSIVDRMTRDYFEVLRFHTMKRLAGDFSYKNEHSMCRVAKGAFKTLRQAIQFIQCEDYTTAESLEAEFLQRIAA